MITECNCPTTNGVDADLGTYNTPEKPNADQNTVHTDVSPTPYEPTR